MAVSAPRRHRPAVLHGYRRLLVPVVDHRESQRAINLACRLASENGATLTVVAVLEVPPLLPLDSHLAEEERAARLVLERAGATADAYGVRASTRLLRARDAGTGIVDLAKTDQVELIVVGSGRKSPAKSSGPGFGATVQRVLEGAPCRVMLVASGS